MSSLLSVRDAAVSHGKVEAVCGVSLDVPRAGIVSLIGANGAGKTTLLLHLMGFLPGSGTVAFDGMSISGMPVEGRVAAGISLVSEQRDLFGTLSVEDNLRLGGFRRGRSESAFRLEHVYVRFPRLKERRDQMAGTLSGGERQMLAMGRALMAGPRLLMLDEPSLGLAPLIVREIFMVIQDLRRDGVSILLVEQNARAALEISDHATVMELGRVTRSGLATELLEDDGLIESYLGLRREDAA